MIIPWLRIHVIAWSARVGMLACLFVTGEWVHAAAEPLPDEILVRCKEQTGHIRACYYAHEVDHTIFAPAFVLFLNSHWSDLSDYTSGTFEPGNGIGKYEMHTLVKRWQLADRNLASRIIYERTHFKKMAGLCPPPRGNVQQNDLDLLHRWLQRGGGLPDVKVPGDPLADDELAQLAPHAQDKLRRLIHTVDSDPIGRRLLRTALQRGVVIRAEALQEVQAYYEPSGKLLVLDHSVLNSEWKINVLVHELVHTANDGKDNSVAEEAVAQIIGSGVQDRITGVPMACHPYYVFADRLLRYDDLDTLNTISACLEKAGIDCPPDAPPVCR